MASVGTDESEPISKQRTRPTSWPERYVILASISVVLVLLGAAFAVAMKTVAFSHSPPHRERALVKAHRSRIATGHRLDRGGRATHIAKATRTSNRTTYYVSRSGFDLNSGTRPSQAWRTISRVNVAHLRPGDSVIFQGGGTFSDTSLRPGVSGAAGRSIVFGSYGSGQATITQGVWFINHDYLSFDNLRIGPRRGFQGGDNGGGTASHIVVQRCTIKLGANNPAVGIYSHGNDWRIARDTIEDIGNSGMLLNGNNYTISGNAITKVGLDPHIPYGKHGIYLLVSNATITNNRISYFQADGISARLRNSTIRGNSISDGAIGIGFYEYDRIAGTSHWVSNTITGTISAGIYINAGSGGLHPTIEGFVIVGNTIRPLAGPKITLGRTRGMYMLRNNRN